MEKKEAQLVIWPIHIFLGFSFTDSRLSALVYIHTIFPNATPSEIEKIYSKLARIPARYILPLRTTCHICFKQNVDTDIATHFM